jgi:replicative DNA helicase
MLMERDAIARVVDVLEPDDFYSPQHQLLYRVIADLFNESKPVDLITVQSRLQDMGRLESAGGRSYLIALQEPAPTAAAVEYYARIVREKSTLRALIQAGDEVKRLGQEAAEQDVEEVVDRAEAAVFAVGERTITPSFTSLRDLIGQVFDRIDEMEEQHRPGAGLLTGYDDLDGYTAGLQPSDLVIIAARPSMGKTSLMMNVAANVAKQGKAVAVFSLEMAKNGWHCACARGAVSLHDIRSGTTQPTSAPWTARRRRRPAYGVRCTSMIRPS